MNEELLKKYYLKGRLNRSEYWGGWLLVSFGGFVMGILDQDGAFNSEVGSLFFIIIFIFSIVFLILISRLRLHDSGKSGWCLLLIFMPFISFYLVYLLGFKAGDKKLNQYDLHEEHIEKDIFKIIDCSIKGDYTTIKTLLEDKVNTNIQNIDGYTALMMSAFHGHIKILKLLINNGANINTQNNDGQTALMLASLKGHTDTANYLISQGADTTITDKNGYTALDFATKKEHTNIIELFKEDKKKLTDLNKLDSQNKTNNNKTVSLNKTNIFIFFVTIGLLSLLYILTNSGIFKEQNKIHKIEFTGNLSGRVVEGEFKNNILISGSITIPNGEKYIGKFSNNLLHGEGMIVLSDGSKYQGVFENGKIKGLGIHTFSTVNMDYIYIGGLNSGDMAMEGNGIKILNIKSKENHSLIYIGNFKNNKRNGFGSDFFGKASTYIGEFKDDQYNGKGAIIVNGKIMTGEFLNDEFVIKKQTTFEALKKEKNNENTLSEIKAKTSPEKKEKDQNKKELSKNDTICQTRLNDIVNRAKYLSILYGYLEDPDKYESAYNKLKNPNNWLSNTMYNEWGGSIDYINHSCSSMKKSFTSPSIKNVCGNMSQEVLNTEKKVDSLCYRN